MPNVFGQQANSVEEIGSVLCKHGDRVRGTYRAIYVFDRCSKDPYAGARLERPDSLAANPPSVVFPWEQIFLSAAACAGSDYPMLAAHFGVPLERVELVVEGVFDPRWEFDGLAGVEAPPDGRYCFLALHLDARLRSAAEPAVLERIHARVVSNNMVLGALRGIPLTDRLRIDK